MDALNDSWGSWMRTGVGKLSHSKPLPLWKWLSGLGQTPTSEVVKGSRCLKIAKNQTNRNSVDSKEKGNTHFKFVPVEQLTTI